MQESPPELPKLPQKSVQSSGHSWFLAPFFQWLFGGIDYPTEANRRLQEDSQSATIVYAASTTTRWLVLYINHVLQAHEGCDFDFLVGSSGSAVPRGNH